MNTKEGILEAALYLFNRDGAYAVTTRHIAEEMKISPGNLYYHYSNREEIIRVLMQRMIDEFGTVFAVAPEPDGLSSAVYQLINRPVEIMYKYRFFYMEPAALLERDPLLKKMYFAVKKSRIREFRKGAAVMIAAGVLKKNIPREEFDAAFYNMWALNEFIIQSMYMSNEKITEANMRKNFMRILYIMKPFVNEEYRKYVFSIDHQEI